MVEKISKHHVLSLHEQELLDRSLIKEILKEHNLKENVDIMYRMAFECRISSDSEHVDDCLRTAMNQFENQKLKDEEHHIHEHKQHFRFPVRTD